MSRTSPEPVKSTAEDDIPIVGIQFPLTQSSSPSRQAIRILIGLLLGLLRPAQRQRLQRGEPGRDHLRLDDRLIVAALVWTHRRRGTLGELSPLHRWLWQSSQAHQLHEQADNRHQAWWIGHHSAIVAPLKDAIAAFAARGEPVEMLCEIGCGTGRVLADLAERLPEVPQLVGLDLSEAQVRGNRERHAHLPRVSFEAADATVWIRAHARPRWAFLVNGGVLEYFSEAMLERLLRDIATDQAPAIFALVEPIADDYDLDRETASRPYNAELSLGHNYPLWLARCGWRVRYQCFQRVAGVRWLLIVAESVPGP